MVQEAPVGLLGALRGMRMKNALGDVLESVQMGLCGAVVLAWVVVGVEVGGVEALPVLLMPVVAGLYIGRNTARSRWMKELDEKVARLQAREEANEERTKH